MFSQKHTACLNPTVLSNVPPQRHVTLTIDRLRYFLSRCSDQNFIIESEPTRRHERKRNVASGREVLELDVSGKATKGYFRVDGRKPLQDELAEKQRVLPLNVTAQRKILSEFNGSILGRDRLPNDPFHFYQSIDSKLTPNDCGADARDALAAVDGYELGNVLESLAFPRDFVKERAGNKRAGAIITEAFEDAGYSTEVHGENKSIFAYNRRDEGKRVIVVGAHFDGVPQSPGADDNASSVSALLHLAKILGQQFPHLRVVYCAFNAEERGKLGSAELVGYLMKTNRFYLTEAHILDMIGCTTQASNSQHCPFGGMLRPVLDRGDFVGVYANQLSHDALVTAIGVTQSLHSELPIVGLESVAGGLFVRRALNRSDHVSFWNQGVPALLWTDTAGARNQHYHTVHDTPEKIDYEFLYRVTQAVLATVFRRARDLGAFTD